MTAVRIFRSAVGLPLLGLWLASGQPSPGANRVDLTKQTVVAERALGPNARVLLTVDPDDVVHEIAADSQGGRNQARLEADLGTRVAHSGTLVLEGVLPKGRVATQARRVTLENGDVFHVIIAWSYSRYPEVLTPRANLFVFRQRHGEVEKVVEEELGPEFEQLVVGDINHDGRVEILVATRENEEASMDVWQIQTGGEVRKVQRIAGYCVSTLADRFLGQEEGILVEKKGAIAQGGGWCFTVDEYLWSREQ